MITIHLLEKDDWVIIKTENRYGQVKKNQKRDSQDVTVKNTKLGTKVYLDDDLQFITPSGMNPVCPLCGSIMIQDEADMDVRICSSNPADGCNYTF